MAVNVPLSHRMEMEHDGEPKRRHHGASSDGGCASSGHRRNLVALSGLARGAGLLSLGRVLLGLRPLWPRRLPHRAARSEEHTSELQSLAYLVCRLLLEK